MPPPSCFVISPIGPDDSPDRQAANDFLELLVEPALEKYGFVVTRADRIARPTAITTDIVKLVQDSDLCIIDLTNSNPNVFYECGRRHETGKPFIQMIQRNAEKHLPFDVAGIRTVTYDVSTTRAARESVLSLQEFIDNIIASGFSSSTSGDTLSSLAQGLERIERKINQIIETPSSSVIVDTSMDDPLKELLKSPRQAFRDALGRGHLDRAFLLLERIERSAGYSEYVGALMYVALAGHSGAFERMDTEFRALIQGTREVDDRDQLIEIVLDGVRRYFENAGKAIDGMKYTIELYSIMSANPNIDGTTKANAANKIGMLAWVAKDYETCIRYTKVAVGLSREASYLYNLALVFEVVEGRENELRETLKALSECPDLDEDHRSLLKQHGVRVA